MMTLDERMQQAGDNINALQKQIDAINNQMVVLQQRRETLFLSYHRADGALALLSEMKREQEESEKVEESEKTKE